MSELFIIAELGQTHDGSLAMAHAYIDALASTGIDAIKFQVHIAEAESSMYEPFRVKFPGQDKTRMDYWKRIAFDAEQWAELKRHCESLKLDFIASPFSNAAVDLLESIDVKRYKIGSGEVSNVLLLEKISKTAGEIILSSGMSSIAELDQSIHYLLGKDVKLSLLQCTTAYPTTPGQWGLTTIDYFKKRFQIPVGFSDHSGDIYACLGAVARGAELVEFHVVFDKRMPGPDTSSSITIDQVKMLVKGSREIAFDIRSPIDKNDLSDFEDLRIIFGKSLAINKDLPSGHRLTYNDLESKKPSGKGISAASYDQIIGRQLNRDFIQWEFLNENDLIG